MRVDGEEILLQSRRFDQVSSHCVWFPASAWFLPVDLYYLDCLCFVYVLERGLCVSLMDCAARLCFVFGWSHPLPLESQACAAHTQIRHQLSLTTWVVSWRGPVAIFQFWRWQICVWESVRVWVWDCALYLCCCVGISVTGLMTRK